MNLNLSRLRYMRAEYTSRSVYKVRRLTCAAADKEESTFLKVGSTSQEGRGPSGTKLEGEENSMCQAPLAMRECCRCCYNLCWALLSSSSIF